MKYKDLLTGFIRLHVLHHAAEHEIYGQWMIEELARHPPLVVVAFSAADGMAMVLV